MDWSLISPERGRITVIKTPETQEDKASLMESIKLMAMKPAPEKRPWQSFLSKDSDGVIHICG